MISFGTNIQSTTEELSQCTLQSIIEKVQHPHPDLLNKVRQLRIVHKIDTAQYAQLKRTLPYIVCGLFLPPYRKQEHFAYTNYFCLDIDHIQEKGLNIEALKDKLRQDARVYAMFVSPSEDGLKVFFSLDKPCYDKGLYSMFYKLFAASFSKQYGLEQVVDTRTSDVTRACFLTVDESAYFCANATKICISDYVDEANMHDLLGELNEIKQQEATQNKNDKITHIADPDKEAMLRIRQLLNPKAAKPQAPVFVPEVLELIIEGLHDYIVSLGIEITDIRNIQYAKKISCRLGVKNAEVNLFYGKKGFTVVPSPKAGTDPELMNLMVDVVKNYINTL